MESVNEIRIKHWNGEISTEHAISLLEVHKTFLDSLIEKLEDDGKDFNNFYMNQRI